MLVSNCSKRITHPKGGYLIELLMTNNKEICRRKDWNQSRFESCVYIYCKKSDKQVNLGWNVIVSGDPDYFGFTKTFNLNNTFHNRPFVHKLDLLSKIINKEYICYCILGLSEIEAHCLEALLIKQSKKKLTPKGQMFLNNDCLINKRRERKYERFINEYLNLDTQWK